MKRTRLHWHANLIAVVISLVAAACSTTDSTVTAVSSPEALLLDAVAPTTDALGLTDAQVMADAGEVCTQLNQMNPSLVVGNLFLDYNSSNGNDLLAADYARSLLGESANLLCPRWLRKVERLLESPLDMNRMSLIVANTLLARWRPETPWPWDFEGGGLQADKLCFALDSIDASGAIALEIEALEAETSLDHEHAWLFEHAIARAATLSCPRNRERLWTYLDAEPGYSDTMPLPPDPAA